MVTYSFIVHMIVAMGHFDIGSVCVCRAVSANLRWMVCNVLEHSTHYWSIHCYIGRGVCYILPRKVYWTMQDIPVHITQRWYRHLCFASIDILCWTGLSVILLFLLCVTTVYYIGMKNAGMGWAWNLCEMEESCRLLNFDLLWIYMTAEAHIIWNQYSILHFFFHMMTYHMLKSLLEFEFVVPLSPHSSRYLKSKSW